MKSTPLTHADVTRANLLKLADEIPGAWLGIRIAAFLLLLSGWNQSAVAELLGVSRMGLWKWIKGANQNGLKAWSRKPSSGRPPRLNLEQQQQLELALKGTPEEAGFERTRWDGGLVSAFIRKSFGVELKVRQAQNWIHRLGFALIMPRHRYIQATNRGVARFTKGLKKTS